MTDDRAAEPTPVVDTVAADAEVHRETVEPPTDPAPDPAELQALADQRAERERKRLRQTVRDMVLSMAVVAGVVLVIFQPWGRSTPDPVRTVDPAPVVSVASIPSHCPASPGRSRRRPKRQPCWPVASVCWAWIVCPGRKRNSSCATG